MRSNKVWVVKNAILIPGGIIIYEDCLHPQTFRWERFDQSTRFLKARDSGDGIRFRIADQDWPKPNETIQEAFFFDHEYVDHYGHFLVELLSRTWALNEDVSLRAVPLLTSGRAEFSEGLLRFAGLADTPIIRFNEAVKVRRLYIASQSIVLDKGATTEAKSVYSNIISRIPASSETPEKVYLSRRTFPTKVGRLLVNEISVANLLERQGFQTVFPEKLTVREQLKLYRHAKFLAGEAGTIMLNRLFQSSQSAELLFGPSEGIEPNHAILRSLMGLGNVKVVNGQSLDSEKHPYGAPWHLDLNDIENGLNLLLQGPSSSAYGEQKS